MEDESSEPITAEEELAYQSLANADLFLHQCDYGKAVAHYLLSIKFLPEKKEFIKDRFSLAFKEWSDVLVDDCRIDELFECYSSVQQTFPECETVVNCMGTILFRLGMVDEAANCFRKAIRINPDYLGAKENLENTCSHLVERWHFGMLNDLKRNQAYRAAIHRAVARGHSRVLDIGSGTGLLSLFASEAGASKIYACEKSKTMYDISNQVLERNLTTPTVKTIEKISTELSIPEDLDQRVSLVVTETFDAGLLGEAILPTLQHAWKNLIEENSADQIESQVIPAGSTVYMFGVECEYIRRRHRLVYSGLRHLDLPEDYVTSDVCLTDGEPYTCEMLSSIPGGYKTLTATPNVWDFDFQSLQDRPEKESRKISLLSKSDGRLDALVLWFDLHLDEVTTLSSSPTADTCWQQAVYPILPHVITGDSDMLIVHKEDTLQVSITCRDNALWLDNISVVKHAENMQRNCTCTFISNEKDSKLEKFPCYVKNVTSSLRSCSSCNSASVKTDQISKHIISSTDLVRLNDIEFNTRFCMFMEYTLRKVKQPKSCSILHLSLGISSIPLQCLKLGVPSLTVSPQNLESLNVELLETICEQNQIDIKKLTFCQREFDDELDAEDKFDMLLVDLVEPGGCMQQQILEDIALARVTSIKPNGIIVPHAVTVWGVIIDSPELARDSGVMDDSDTLGFHIAEFINDYQMTTHEGIYLSTLNHTRLSQPFELVSFMFNNEPRSRVPSYLNHDSYIKVPIISPGDTTAIVYWYEMKLGPSPMDCKTSTLDLRCHWAQAAIIQRNPIALSEGENVQIHIICRNSCIKATVEKL